MERLIIHPKDLEAIGRHGEARYPEECCGILVGRSGEGVTAVERVVAVANEREEDRREGFLVHPEKLLAVHMKARKEGLDVVGYYHSHPDHPARPSEVDRKQAWPGLSYVILSVEEGRVAEIRSWRLIDYRKGFEEETIEEEAIEGERNA